MDHDRDNEDKNLTTLLEEFLSTKRLSGMSIIDTKGGNNEGE